MGVITHIYARNPRIAVISIGTIVRTYFRIHTVVLGQREEVLGLHIEAELRQALPGDKALKIVAQRDVLQTDVVAILQVEVGELPVAHITVSDTRNAVAGALARPAVQYLSAVVALRGVGVAVGLGNLESGGTGGIQAEVEALYPKLRFSPKVYLGSPLPRSTLSAASMAPSRFTSRYFTSPGFTSF